MNINVKKIDYKVVSQMLATPAEGKRRGVRDGRSHFALHTLASWSLLQENGFMYDLYIFKKRLSNS